MIKTFIDPKLKKLISEICSEHREVSGSMDSNIGYLWYLYDSGMKKGNYKPFIFLSELNLLVKTGYVTEDEKQNMLGMLLSADEDNTYLVAYSILTLRTARIKDLGLWVPVNEQYSKIDYSRDIINTQMFNKL